MRKRLIVIALALLLAACNTAPEATLPDIPVIKVDEEHFRQSGLYYAISPTQSFMVDATEYQFAGGRTIEDVNFVEVVLYGKAYGQHWTPGQLTQQIDAASLQTVDGTHFESAPFSPGALFLIAVGNLDSKLHFHPFWVATVMVE
jgi:hypothetical protein